MGKQTTGKALNTLTLSQAEVFSWLTHGVIMASEPGHVIIAWGDSKWAAESEENHDIWFYFPDYFLQEKHPWVTFSNVATLKIEELLHLLHSVELNGITPIKWGEPIKETFQKGFFELQELFRTTELEKVVLYSLSKAEEPFSLSKRKNSICSLLNYVEQTHTYLYGFWEEGQGTLGATPELLFKVRKNDKVILETMALAGTCKTDQHASLMLKDHKLLNEHNIVVEEITRKLEPFGLVSKDPLRILSLPLLSHLQTHIRVELAPERYMAFPQIVQALHPTPALGGYPQEFASNWLAEYNAHIPRGRFGAPVGYRNLRTREHGCYVGIRNVMWDNNTLTIGAGCGIVAESNFEKEWSELLLKTESIKRMLNI